MFRDAVIETGRIVSTWLQDRRFILSVGCGAVTSLLCYLGKITSGDYNVVTIATVGTFIGGHVYQAVKGQPS